MDLVKLSRSPRGRQKIALHMADAILFLLSIATLAGFKSVRSRLAEVQIELTQLSATIIDSSEDVDPENKTELS